MKSENSSGGSLLWRIILGLMIVGLFAFGGLFWLARIVLEKFELGQVLTWGALVTASAPFLVLAAYGLGFYLGKVEARGALSGIDQTTERLARVVDHAVNVRDTSRVNVRNAINPDQAATPIVLFPTRPGGYPEIEERGGPRSGGPQMLDID